MRMNVLLMAVMCSYYMAIAGSNTDFTVSLEIHGGECSNMLTLICRHDTVPTDPTWIHNGTAAEGGELLASAFPSLTMYSFQNSTEHRVTVTGVDDVTALDGYVFQCVYSIQGTLIKSNAVQYSFVPNDFHPKLMTVNVFQSFSGSFCTLNYTAAGYTKGIAKYPNCINQFTVDFNVAPVANVSSVTTGDVRLYNITNLERCTIYDTFTTSFRGGQLQDTLYAGDSVMTSPGAFEVVNVTFISSALSVITIQEITPDCPLFPTRWYNVTISQVNGATVYKGHVMANTSNTSNGSVTITVPFDTPLPQGMLDVEVFKVVTAPVRELNEEGTPVDTEHVREWNSSSKATGVFNPHVPPIPLNTAGVAEGVAVAAVIAAVTVLCVTSCIFLKFFWKRKTRRLQSQLNAPDKTAASLNHYETQNHSHQREADGTDGVGGSGLHSPSSIADFELHSSQTLISLVEDEEFSSDTLTQGVVSAPEDTLAEETGQTGALETNGLEEISNTANVSVDKEEAQCEAPSANEPLGEMEVFSTDTLTQGVVSATEATLAEETDQTGALEANGLEEISDTANVSVDKEETQCEALSAKVPLGEVENVVMMKAVGSHDMALQVNTQMAHQQLSAAKATGVDMVGTNPPHYAQIVFSKKGAIPAPKNELYNVQYADIKT